MKPGMALCRSITCLRRVAAKAAEPRTMRPENHWYSAKLPMCRQWRQILESGREVGSATPQMPRRGAGAKKLDILPDNHMQPANLANASRCGARTRSGAECRSPAVRGKRRCRMHGGNSCGAPKGNRNAWKHGDRSAQTEDRKSGV